MRKTLVATCTLILLAIPAGAAWARGDGWQKLNNQPVDASCGSTTVHVTFPVDNEYFRTLTLRDGTVELQTTGRLVTNFATDSGASVSFNTSGPSKFFIYPNGDAEFRGTGLTSGPGFLLPSGSPDIFVSSGPLDDIFHPDGSITYVRAPHHVTDVCAALGLS